MKVLVTGATGFIGKQLLLHLRDRGHEIVVLTRQPEMACVRLPVLCRVFCWDKSFLEPPKEAFEGVDAVVHLAGENIIGRWTPARKEELSRSRLLSTRQIVKVLHGLEKKPKVFVCASGVGYYGDQPVAELDETAPPGKDFLADLCRRWEAEAMQAEAVGVRTVPLRIGVVLGADGGALQKMLPAFRLGLGGALGHGRQWLSWIHERDMAGLILHAIENSKVMGPVNAVSPNPVSNADFAKALAQAVHRPAFLNVPAPVVKLLLGDVAGVVLTGQKAFPKKALASGYTFHHPQLSSALATLCDRVTHELLIEQWVPQPLDKVFAFFSDTKNLELLTPPHLRFKITGQSTTSLQEGTRINYQLKLHGVPFRWQSIIMDWKPGERFSDIQVLGPYRLWHHTHDFIEQDGGTLIRDRAVYRIPLGVAGDLLLRSFIRKDLEAIFIYRWHKVQTELGGVPPQPEG